MRFCSLYSGSSGNALFVATENTRILIDAGVSGIRIERAMRSIGEDPADLDAVLLTHEHGDHCRCIGVMSRRFGLPVYTSRAAWHRVSGYIGRVHKSRINHFCNDRPFSIRDIEISPFSIPHDAVDPVGFSFTAGGRRVTVATDIGHMNSSLFRSISHSDLLMLESNHDMDMLVKGSYPQYLKERIKSDHGHLSNAAAGAAIARLAKKGMKRFILGHLSEENNCPELAYETVKKHLTKSGFKPGEDVELSVALRHETSEVFEI